MVAVAAVVVAVAAMVGDVGGAFVLVSVLVLVVLAVLVLVVLVVGYVGGAFVLVLLVLVGGEDVVGPVLAAAAAAASLGDRLQSSVLMPSWLWPVPSRVGLLLPLWPLPAAAVAAPRRREGALACASPSSPL